MSRDLESPAPSECCRARGHRAFRTVIEELTADVDRYLDATARYAGSRSGFLARVSALLTPSLLALALHRLAHYVQGLGFRGPARALATLNFFLTRARIEPSSCVLGGWHLPHPSGILFHAVAGTELTIYSQAACAGVASPLDETLEQVPRLGHRVTIGVHGAVVGACRVGDGASVAFRTIVTKDLPAGATALGGRRARIAASGTGADPTPSGSGATLADS